jgi:hypothetical protein
VPKYSDWSAIIAETLSQMGSESIRPSTQLAICQPAIAADVRDRVWGRKGPVVDSFD